MAYQEQYINVDFEKKGHVAYITLNNPKTLNALSYDTFQSLNAIFDEMTLDNDVWGVIMTGAGRSFVAGADLSDSRMQNANYQGAVAARETRKNVVHDCFNRIIKFERPILAAINGYCLGGGAELALCTDFRFASSRAKIGYPEVKLGGIPSYAGVSRAMHLLPQTSAKEMLFTGKHFTAEEALRLGFVSRVVEPEQLMPEAEEFMAQICKMAPLAVKYCKITADRCMEMSADAGLELERIVAGVLSTTEDAREGKAAFREKRDPVFQGR